jgi:peptide/nickel transport system permease protein
MILFALARCDSTEAAAQAGGPAAAPPAAPRSEYVLTSRETAKALVQSAAGPSVLISAAAATVTYGLAISTAFSILFFGAWTRRLLRQILDMMACVSPLILLLVVYVARQHAGHLFVVFLALAIFPLVGRPLLARVTEASQNFHFTEAKVLGHSSLGVFRHYAWPRFLPLTLPYFFLGFIQSLLMESMFSSLGLVELAGGQTWGSLIHKGLEDLLDQPWLVFYAGSAIMATTLTAYLCVPLLDRLLSLDRKA